MTGCLLPRKYYCKLQKEASGGWLPSLGPGRGAGPLTVSIRSGSHPSATFVAMNFRSSSGVTVAPGRKVATTSWPPPEGLRGPGVDGQRDRSCPCRPWRRVVLSVASVGLPGSLDARTHGGRRRPRIAPRGVYVLVSGVLLGQKERCLKNRRLSLRWFEPNTLPLPAKTAPRLRKRVRRAVSSCHVMYRSVSQCVDALRCPRTHSGRRPCRQDGRVCGVAGHGCAAAPARVVVLV
jgi:hypothetical protein